MRKRHVPVKALILDQAVISGVGNWVADESLYYAKLHPEQYCNEFSDEEIKRLHGSIRHICQTAVDLLADSDKFPDTWIFNHRWGKGKGATELPNGEKLAWITVGGRTSCYVPAAQKKTGHVAPGIKEEALDGDDDAKEKSKRGKGKKPKVEKTESKAELKTGKTTETKSESFDVEEANPKKGKARKSRAQGTDEDEEERPVRKRAKAKAKPEAVDGKSKKTNVTQSVADLGRRRSARLSNGS